MAAMSTPEVGDWYVTVSTREETVYMQVVGFFANGNIKAMEYRVRPRCKIRPKSFSFPIAIWKHNLEGTYPKVVPPQNVLDAVKSA